MHTTTHPNRSHGPTLDHGDQAYDEIRRLGRENTKAEGFGGHVCGEWRQGYVAHREAVVVRLGALAAAMATTDGRCASMVRRFALAIAEDRPLDGAIVDAALR